MTVPIEDRLRSVLLDMADEVQPSPPPVELRLDAARLARWRPALAAVAAVAAVLLVVGAAAMLREPPREFHGPITSPPKVIKLVEELTAAPGRSAMAVLPGISAEAFRGGRHLQLVPAGGGPAPGLRNTRWVPTAYAQHLSWDGTRVVRQFDRLVDPRLEIVNLEDGTTNRLGGQRGYCPTLSPDNRTVAVVSPVDERLTLLDAQDGRVLRKGPEVPDAACVQLGWSPDGQLFTVPDGDEQLVIDGRGRTVATLGQHRPVNGHMSWSPDARSLLLYDAATGQFLVKDVLGGAETRLSGPPGGIRPLGWTGSRVVWLVGAPDAYRLVSTDQTGSDVQTWTSIDAGGRVIESVEWSRDLSGQPAGDD